jgi:hypothetical protein
MAERENERKRIQAMASVSAQAEPERVIDVEALTASGYWWGQ